VLSSFALVLGLSILNGLHTTTLQTLKGFTPDIIMRAPQGSSIDITQFGQILTSKKISTIAAYAPYTITPIVILSRYNPPTPGSVISLSKKDFAHMYPQAIVQCANTASKSEPLRHETSNNSSSSNNSPNNSSLNSSSLNTISLHNDSLNNNSSSNKFSQTASSNTLSETDTTSKKNTLHTCIISRSYAQSNDIALDSSIEIATYEYNAHAKSTSYAFETYLCRVEGIYDHPSDQEIFPTIISTDLSNEFIEQPSSEQCIGIYIKDQQHLAKTAAQLTSLFPDIALQTWHEMFPELCAACSLETYGFIAIVLLIIIISGTNLASLTTLFIANKRREIEILALNGMNKHSIRSIFYTINISITIFSTLMGETIALAVAYIMNTYHIIAMPTTIYYSAFLPAYPSIGIIMLPFILFIILALIISYITLRSEAFTKEHL
jgi:ABC-type lipoprotein release transport system permease subunit